VERLEQRERGVNKQGRERDEREAARRGANRGGGGSPGVRENEY